MTIKTLTFVLSLEALYGGTENGGIVSRETIIRATMIRKLWRAMTALCLERIRHIKIKSQ